MCCTAVDTLQRDNVDNTNHEGQQDSPTESNISPPVFVAHLRLGDLLWHHGGTCADTTESCLQRVRADRGARFP